MPVTRDSPSIQGDVPGPDPARAPPNKAIAQAGLACRGQLAGVCLARQGPPRGAPLPPRATRTWSTFGPHAIEACARVAAANGTSLEGWPCDVSRQGCRRSREPRKTRWVAGRRMARTGFPPAPGSRHRGSVGDHPRYGGRAVCPPAPSDSPSLETHEGARRPALYGGTSARLAVAPYAPFLASAPHMGDNPISIRSNRHPAFYTASQPPSDHL